MRNVNYGYLLVIVTGVVAYKLARNNISTALISSPAMFGLLLYLDQKAWNNVSTL